MFFLIIFFLIFCAAGLASGFLLEVFLILMAIVQAICEQGGFRESWERGHHRFFRKWLILTGVIFVGINILIWIPDTFSANDYHRVTSLTLPDEAEIISIEDAGPPILAVMNSDYYVTADIVLPHADRELLFNTLLADTTFRQGGVIPENTEPPEAIFSKEREPNGQTAFKTVTFRKDVDTVRIFLGIE